MKCDMLACVEVNVGGPLRELLAISVNLDSGKNHAKVALVKRLKKCPSKLRECRGVEILRTPNSGFGHPSEMLSSAVRTHCWGLWLLRSGRATEEREANRKQKCSSHKTWVATPNDLAHRSRASEA